MKFLVNIVLALFLSFLSAPTIISLIENDTDMSIVYSLTEEEIQKEIKEIKAQPQCEFQISVFTPLKKSTLIRSENLQRHDNVFEEIFSPPPEFI